MMTLLKPGSCWQDTFGNVFQVKAMHKTDKAPYKGVSILECLPLLDPPTSQTVFITAEEALYYMGHIDVKPVYALPPDPLMLA